MNADSIDQTTTTTPAPESTPRVLRVRRPFPWVRVVAPSDVSWEPQAEELFYVRAGSNVRAGESYAIVRPGHDFPLGICSDHYRVTSHNATRTAIMSFCSDLVRPNGIVVSGHGYQVAHGYIVQHSKATAVLVGDVQLGSKLVVVNDHTGSGSLRASLVTYVGGEAVGAIVRDRALHVGDQPEMWHGRVSAMIETAILVQDALLDLLRAAAARVLSDEDRDFLRKRGVIVRGEATTALEAIVRWHSGGPRHDRKGKDRRVSWGVWERRMGDEGILALCHLLGRVRYGRAIDRVVNSPTYPEWRYGGRPTAAEEAAEQTT